jgi:hypothetical protein
MEKPGILPKGTRLRRSGPTTRRPLAYVAFRVIPCSWDRSSGLRGSLKELFMKKRNSANDNRKTAFTDEEAIDVWLRIWRGDLQDDIAHDYRINAGRVSGVVNEKTHIGSREAAEKLRQKSA